ncbi:MAG: zinc ribbon domain-containing protein [Clostridia bacterium]|nr:zinc ribbon domain-containing protein [Clostridia bacterium]
MTVCPNCNSAVPDGASFCPACGANTAANQNRDFAGAASYSGNGTDPRNYGPFSHNGGFAQSPPGGYASPNAGAYNSGAYTGYAPPPGAIRADVTKEIGTIHTIGILSIVFTVLGVVHALPVIAVIAGLVLGAVGLSKIKRLTAQNPGLQLNGDLKSAQSSCKASLIISIVVLVLDFVLTVLCILIFFGMIWVPFLSDLFTDYPVFEFDIEDPELLLSFFRGILT